MPRKLSAVPKLLHHKASNRAKVRVAGQDIYFGTWGSEQAREGYRRYVAEYTAAPAVCPSAAKVKASGIVVGELILAYSKHRQEESVRPLSANERLAIRLLRELYGRTKAAGFGPLKLVALRKKLIEAELCRTEINGRVSAIKRAFRWAASMELIPGETWHSLDAVKSLEKGTRGVREGKKVRPVPDSVIEATCRELHPMMAALVRFVRLTGCRIGEACALTPKELDRFGEVWTFRPGSHKTAHHGKDRVIKIGPKAQAILQPLLEGIGPDEAAFSPRRAMEARFEVRRAARRTKVQPSQQGHRKGRGPEPREYGDRYNHRSVGLAIRRAAARAGVPHWHAHQLRHSAATEIRSKIGIEAARAVLGHSTLAMTDHYAEIDAEKAAEAMRKIG